MSDTAKQIRERLDVLEAERLILTIELRSELLRAAKELLPEAIRQAHPVRGRKKGERPRPGSPALLRLIARLRHSPRANAPARLRRARPQSRCGKSAGLRGCAPGCGSATPLWRSRES